MNELYLNHRKGVLAWPLLGATAALLAVGVFFIFSAGGEGAQDVPWYRQSFFLQIIWAGVGMAAAAAVCLVDYAKLARWAPVIYWASLASLAGVFVVGAVIHGARRWINLGMFSLQPSEFAKIAFVLLLAQFLSRPVEELRQGRVFWAALGYTALPFGLVLIEPDLGSSLGFLSTSLALLFVAGAPKRFLIPLVGGGGAAVVLAAAAVVFVPTHLGKIASKYQRNNVTSFLGLTRNYEVEQSLISVGSGGLFGKGWRQGTQHELGYLPLRGASDDFIFAVMAEEEGFVGSVVILALYAVLLFSGIKIASQARDRLGKLLALGVVTLLFTHVFINIGMNIHLMPVTGIPLPLVSYGGSSVVCSLIAIGILHNVHIYRRAY